MTKQIGSQVPIIGESFESRRDVFLKEVDALGSKYQIAIKPELKYTYEGIVPSLKVFDVKKDSQDKATKGTQSN